MCRACENVCPATVPYGKLLDGFRAEYGRGSPPLFFRLKSRIISWIFRSKERTRLLHYWLRLLWRLRLDAALNKLGLKSLLGPGRRSTALPSISPISERSAHYPAVKKECGVVGLFTGCTGEIFDGNTINAGISLLTSLGYSVVIPQSQVCCGALDFHAGKVTQAEALFRRNIIAFDDSRCDTIVSIASGCGAMLKEYAVYCDGFRESAAFSSKVKDISQFIVDSGKFDRFGLSSLDAKVYVHSPCSLRNVMHEQDGALRLLAAVPDVSLIPQPETINCCGAAGSYMIEHPKISRALRDPLLQSISREKPDYVVSSNIGCALHLQGGIRASGAEIEVLHPVVLVDRLRQQ